MWQEHPGEPPRVAAMLLSVVKKPNQLAVEIGDNNRNSNNTHRSATGCLKELTFFRLVIIKKLLIVTIKIFGIQKDQISILRLFGAISAT